MNGLVRRFIDDSVRQYADPADLDVDRASWYEPHLRISGITNPARSAGCDDVTGLESGEG